MKKYYFLVNLKGNNSLIGGHNYESMENAEGAIENRDENGDRTCNIPKDDVKIEKFQFNFPNSIDHSKCTPLRFDNMEIKQ